MAGKLSNCQKQDIMDLLVYQEFRKCLFPHLRVYDSTKFFSLRTAYYHFVNENCQRVTNIEMDRFI